MDYLKINISMKVLMKKKEVPVFRFEALEEKFIGHLNRVCEIFRDFGTLKESFNIKQMMNILKIPKWAESPPLAFYLEPLQTALTDMRECLLKMNYCSSMREGKRFKVARVSRIEVTDHRVDEIKRKNKSCFIPPMQSGSIP